MVKLCNTFYNCFPKIMNACHSITKDVTCQYHGIEHGMPSNTLMPRELFPIKGHCLPT